MRTTWLKTLSAASAVALLASGCGSDDGGSGGGGGGDGDPIKVMVLSQLEAPDFAYPETEDVIQAAVDIRNEDDGIQGRQIELLFCNDQRDANAAGACARQAVSEQVSLVLAPFSLFAGTTLPILEAAGIPYAGNQPYSPQDLTSPVSFPFNGVTVVGGAALGQRLAEDGCTEAGAIGYDNAASNAYISYVEAGLQEAGGEFVNTAFVAPGTPDYAPALASLEGVQCIFLSMPPAEAAKLLAAQAQTTNRVQIGTGITTLPQQVVDSVAPETVEGTVLTGTSYAETDDVPEVQEMKDALSAAGVSDEAINAPFAVESWGAAQIAFGAMDDIDGEINAASTLEALGNITEPASNLFGPFSTTEEFDVEGFNRLFNRNALHYTVRDGVNTLDSPDFVDATDALSRLGS